MTWRKIEEAVRLFRLLTIRRMANALAIYLSYQISRMLRRPVHWGMPVSISVEPTTACNLRCPECPSGLRSFTRPTGKAPWQVFESLVNEVAPYTTSMILYFQGEPFLHPKFLDMVRYASRARLYTITSTNGHFLTDQMARQTVESGLNRLVVSIDGITQQTYESYRKGGKLEQVLEGARRIVHWKRVLGSKAPYLVFQFLVVAPNEHEISEARRLAVEIGFDEVSFKTAQLYDYKNGHELMPADSRYTRYTKQSDGTFALKYRRLNQCWKMWHSCVVTWDGQLVPCCFDKDAHHVMGRLDESTVRDIWKGNDYQMFRSSILRGREEIDICRNCSEGCQVWA